MVSGKNKLVSGGKKFSDEHKAVLKRHIVVNINVEQKS